MAQDQPKLSEKQATEIGTDVYIYGYPLVTLEMTRRLTTNTRRACWPARPDGPIRPPPNIPARDVPGYPRRQRRYAVLLRLAGPRQGTLHSQHSGRRGPLLHDAHAGRLERGVSVPGTRTTGTKAQTYAITGPNWKGELPAGVTEYKSATNMVWIIGRTYTTGTPEDYEKVHAFQDKLSLVPLSAYGKDYTPPKGKVDPGIDMKTPTKDQVVSMDAAAYFKLLATLMKDNPPTAADAPMVAEMAKIGLVPGKDWDIGALDPTIAAGLAQAPKAALAKMMAHAPNAGKVVNGWLITRPAGVFGTDYLQRAFLNWQGPGWNRLEDSVYPLTKVDGEGKTLSGAKQYVIHFAKGELPPVQGFWSLTLYDTEGFFVPNPLDRVNLSQQSAFNFNEDGSLDLYIQNDSPGKDKEANWLPCPKGDFALFMRLYWPNEKAPSILDGSWMPPQVEKVK